MQDIEKKITSNKNDFCVNEITSAIVKINEFSASSIDILVRCFTNNNDFQEFLNVKDKISVRYKKKLLNAEDVLLPFLLSLYILKKS